MSHFQRFLEDFSGDLSEDMYQDIESSQIHFPGLDDTQIFDQEDETVSLNIFELARDPVYRLNIDWSYLQFFVHFFVIEDHVISFLAWSYTLPQNKKRKGGGGRMHAFRTAEEVDLPDAIWLCQRLYKARVK